MHANFKRVQRISLRPVPALNYTYRCSTLNTIPSVYPNRANLYATCFLSFRSNTCCMAVYSINYQFHHRPSTNFLQKVNVALFSSLHHLRGEAIWCQYLHWRGYATYRSWDGLRTWQRREGGQLRVRVEWWLPETAAVLNSCSFLLVEMMQRMVDRCNLCHKLLRCQIVFLYEVYWSSSCIQVLFFRNSVGRWLHSTGRASTCFGSCALYKKKMDA